MTDADSPELMKFRFAKGGDSIDIIVICFMLYYSIETEEIKD